MSLRTHSASAAQSSSRLRRLATGGAAAALTLAGMAVAGPAVAAAGEPLNYTCATPLGAKAFQATYPAPATVAVGGSVALTTSVLVPEDMASMLYGLGQARTLAGTATGAGTVNGQAVTANQTIPVTVVPASGPATVVAKGGVPVPAAIPVGTVLDVAVGDFSVNLVGKKADGTPAVLSPYAISCALNAEQDSAIGQITVVKAGSTTKVKAKAAKGKATVTATVKSTTTVKATGKVKLTLKKGSKKITKTATVKNGKAVVTVKKLKAGKYKITAAYTGDKNVLASSGKGSVKVK